MTEGNMRFLDLEIPSSLAPVPMAVLRPVPESVSARRKTEPPAPIAPP